MKTHAESESASFRKFHHISYNFCFYSINLQIPMGGQLPEKICDSCYSKCKVWHSFRSMCHENHQHLFLITTAPIESVGDLTSLEIKSESIAEETNPTTTEETSQEDTSEAHPMVLLPSTATLKEAPQKPLPAAVKPVIAAKATRKTSGVWNCPVCKTKLSPCVRLRDHLKVHLSENVS